MSFKWFDWYSWVVGVLVSGLILLLGGLLLWPFSVFLSWPVIVGGLFCVDVVGVLLMMLSSVLGVSLFMWVGEMDSLTIKLVFVSIFFSFLCYCSVSAILFWVFYEGSIVSLLVLLIVRSPYSERYIASWYLLGYIVLTSLPMLLCFCYIGMLSGSFKMQSWSVIWDEMGVVCMVGLSVMFVTKMPLPPFHVWLPIVHAEASSPVSVCLSGYIMKLGVLGVCRFCFSVLPDYVFSVEYTLLCFVVSILFFFAATRELDGKRWLAFLSLAHMLVVLACMSMGGWGLSSSVFLYCLGHGVSAGLIFFLLWFVYDISATRNLVLLKSGISSSLFFRVLFCSGLCTACSLPPTVQFFCEVSLVVEAGLFGCLVLLLFYIFIFMGGLVPLFLVGGLLSRHYDISYGLGSVYCKSLSLVLLLFWSFLLFVVCL